MNNLTSKLIDPATAAATSAFLERAGQQFPVDYGILFGSRARQNYRADSDADVAAIMKGPVGNRSTLAIAMAGIAFDVLLDTGVLVQALPLWDDELHDPEQFGNPALIHNIHREGIRL
ncbi:MAG: nucleotidyltransferase domain-containing protein [Burkholderiaceae bacterium]